METIGQPSELTNYQSLKQYLRSPTIVLTRRDLPLLFLIKFVSPLYLIKYQLTIILRVCECACLCEREIINMNIESLPGIMLLYAHTVLHYNNI